MAGDATEVGAIVAYLSMDRSDWKREIDAAKRDARELGMVDPKIKVTVDGAGKAIAELTAVEAATKRVDTAAKKAASKGGGPGLLLTSIVAFGPALAPLAGGAAVLGGAFAGLGASGILAFKGIQAEIKANTAEGKQFSAGVTTIKGDLGKLEAVAASNVLAGYQASIRTINADMPSLVKSTSVFSKDLGDIGKHTISGLLGTWQALTPELEKGAGWVDTIAVRFDSWANGPGGAKFARALGDDFQRVVPFLQDTATAVGHLFEAANSSGALETLDGIVRLFNAIPIDVLKVAIPLASGLVLSIKAMKIATQASLWIGGLSKELATLGVAETGATVAGAGMAASLGPLAAILVGGYTATQVFSDQLDQVANKFATGKIMADQNVTGLQDLSSAYFDVNHTAATSTGTLLQFVLSSKNAGIGVGGLSDQVRDLLPHLDKLGITTGDVTSGVIGNDDAFAKLIDRIKAHGGATAADITALENLHLAVANTGDAADTTADAVTGLTDKQKKLADQTLSTAGQLGIMSNALAELSGNTVDAEQQELRFKDALAGARDQVKANGSAINDNTAKGRSNKEWLLTQISAINSHAEAVGKQTGSVQKATSALASDEKQLRSAAVAAGLNKDQVDALIKKYAATPAQVRTKVLADTKAALGNITTLQANIQALRDHKITITTYLQNVILPGLKTDSSTRDSHHAFGGTVGGGGGPKADDQLAWLSTGEEVIQEPYATRYRSLLKAINAGKFAGGGTVTKSGKNWAYNGILYSTERAAINAQTRAEQAAAKKANAPHDVTQSSGGVQGIIQGVRGAIPNAVASMRDLAKAMDAAFKLRGVDKSLDSVRAKLAATRQDMAQLGSDTTGALRQGFNPATAGTSAVGILSAFARPTDRANKFSGEVSLLGKAGLDKNYIAELARNGGGATLDALAGIAGTSGGKGQLAQISKAYQSYQAATAHAGSVAGATVYGKAIADQAKQVTQLVASDKALRGDVKLLTNAIARLTGRPVVVKLDGKVIASSTANQIKQLLKSR